MKELTEVSKRDDIFPKYLNTPIGDLIEYQNLEKQFEEYSQAKLLVGMCMDNRKRLNIPDNFAFIIRTGGANLKQSEFKVSFAISIGDVCHIALIGHNNCGMVNLHSRKECFISGLVEKAGWTREIAEEHFTEFAPVFEIGNEIDFVMEEAKRLRIRYPKIKIAPMIYLVEENRLYLISEDNM